RIDEYAGGGAVVADIDHGHALRDPDLIGGEAHAFGRPHGVEQVVHQLAHGGVDGGDGRRALPQHRRAEQVELADRHWGLGEGASIDRLRMFVMFARITPSPEPPLFTGTPVSLRLATSAIDPPEVTILSPRC